MDCNEARSALSGEREIDAARRAAARAHVATCAVCQARADQLASAILSEAEEELSCAECLARLDLQGAAILTDGRAGASAAPGAGAPADRRALDPDDLVRAHLARCPECAEAWQLLATGLADLAADRLPTPETWPRFDLSFARDPQPNAPRPAGWWPRARVRLDASTPLRGLERLFARWRVRSAAPAWQGLSRASLAGLALLIVLGLAWLLRSGTSLPQQIRSLSPFDTPTPSQADIAATQTMAVEMGIDWVDAAGAGGARTPTPDGLAPGSGRGTPMGARRASPSPTQGSGTAPAAGPREPDRGRERLATRPPEPTRVEPSAMVTGTLRPRGNIAYPPPPLATRDPYPGPGAPEPRPIAPTAGAATAPAPTPAPEPSLAPEPSAEPSAEP